IHPEDFNKLLFHAHAVHVLDFVPHFQGDHQVHTLLAADAFHAEDRRDIDDADASHFHVIACQFRAGADDFASVHQRHFRDIIRHQAVTALDQRQDTLAFPDAAFAANDDSHPEDVHHAAHL